MSYYGFLRGLALILLLLGSPVAMAQGKPSVAADGGYVIGIDDVIEISLVGVDSYKVRAKVQADGSVPLPYGQSVTAADKTALQLSREVAGQLSSAGYYVKPQVLVDVVSYASRYVTVLGAVTSPGLVPIDRAYRVSEILARVGGKQDKGAEYLMLRRQDGAEMKLNIAGLATGDNSQDPFVAAGDKIYVPDAESFFIYGQVNAPGVYPVRAGMSVRQAIARGGGLTELGTEKRVKIFRQGIEVKETGLESPVRQDDVVVVGERYF